ncbi:MAG TPA: flavodoxin family protein [Planctomycetota bacterium]|nr:flavodoxin family protein [Planctomycetota bacterium]
MARRVRIRDLQPDGTLSRAEFERRFRESFFDPAFEAVGPELERVMAQAWDGYIQYRKSPRTRRAGARFAEPDEQLPVEWLAARAAIHAAERRQRSRRSPARILLISGSSRTSESCPGETSKTWRLCRMAEAVMRRAPRLEVDFLDLSLLASQPGRRIFPCKACVSTAMPLCHWPCSCYPNHAMQQTGDWMAELYPRWAAAHGVMIVCPVNWYQAPSVLKLMIDRLVCADGGNPDPTTTHGKDVKRAKALELRGWDYPRHLAGRLFSVVVHGDAAGAGTLRRSLVDWLADMGLVPAGPQAQLDRYIGYWRDYATSHDDLDADRDVQEEVRNAARELVNAVRLQRRGRLPRVDKGLKRTREK